MDLIEVNEKISNFVNQEVDRRVKEYIKILHGEYWVGRFERLEKEIARLRLELYKKEKLAKRD
jgi:hypothetical protein